MTTILYSGQNPFTGISPTPLLSRTITPIRFGSRWAQRHDITLKGVLTGKCLSYQQFLTRQGMLLSGFRQDFQTLSVIENGSGILRYDYVKVNNISFDRSTYAIGYIPYEISLEAYPSGYFSGQFGVLNPNEKFEFSEDEQGSVRITHTTSAQGICTSSGTTNNALENARSWVAARTGWSSQVLPQFISGWNGSACLQTLAENTDRLNATYEVTETYLGDIYADSSDGFLRYSTDFSSGIEDGICTMEVQGSLRGCRYQNISGLRTRYAAFNAFNEALNRFQFITNRTDLSSFPVSKGVSEDTTSKAINFNYIFNDDLRPKVNVVYEVSFEYDFEQDVISASISATVSSKAAYDSSKWTEVLAVANSLNLYSLVVGPYNVYVLEVAPHLAGIPLNPVPTSLSRSDNQFLSQVNLGASYTNAPTPPNGLDAFTSNITINPPLHQFQSAPIYNGLGQYYIFDLGFKSRASAEIQVEGHGNDNTSAAQTLIILKNQVQKAQNIYFKGTKMLLDNQSFNTSTASFGKQATVSASFSADQTEFSLT